MEVAAAKSRSLLSRVKKSLSRRLLRRPEFHEDQAKFNADPMDIKSDPNPKIVLVHVGKCAGETVRRTLFAKLPNVYSIYEMHCFDADERIRTCLESPIDGAHYVVCTRDPLKRFISAYNWDKHNMYASGRLAGKRFNAYFEEFASVEYLAESLAADDAERRFRAQDFRRYGHMGMGQAWYTPRPVVDLLPWDRTHLVDQSSLRADLSRMLAAMGAGGLGAQEDIGNDKAEYKRNYPTGFFSNDLSDRAKGILTNELQEDFEVLTALRRDLPAPQSSAVETPCATANK